MMTEPGSFSGTVMHPAVVVLTILSCMVIILANLRYSIILMTLLSIMIPLGQRVEVLNLNFHVLRLLILAGWIKILCSQKLKFDKIQKIDKVMIYWVVVSFVVYIIQQYNIDAVKNRLGFAYNAMGVYFLYRILIQRKENIDTICNTLAFASAFVAICMIIEQWTGKNFFYIFGGVEKYTPVRMGRLRSQGPFAHAINAGVFGATMFPLYFSMWRHKWGNAFWGIIGVVSACVIVITSSSATPIIAGAAGFAALLFWPFRAHLRKLRYGILFTAVLLQIVLVSPIWAFIKKIDVIRGSSALHRFQLVDNLINRVDEWFLFGTSLTANWGSGMEDKANQYYSEAVTGGFLKLVLFIMIIAFGFKMIGKNVKTLSDISSRKKLWALGSSLFANMVAFIGISYWDQMLFVWYLLLALITSTCLIYSESLIGLAETSTKDVRLNTSSKIANEIPG